MSSRRHEGRCRDGWRTLQLGFIALALAGCNQQLLQTVVTAEQSYVRVMTFNIFHDAESESRQIPSWDGRRDNVLAIIKSGNPDVLGLQEAYMDQVSWLKNNLTESYGSVGRGREADGDDESVSILYRKDKFDEIDSGHFWLSESPSTPGSKFEGMDQPSRMVTWIRLRRESTGKSFYVYNTHFPTNDGDPPNQFRVLAAKLLTAKIRERAHPEDTYVITGDLNAEESEWSVAFLRGELSEDELAVCNNPATWNFCQPWHMPLPAIDAFRAEHPNSDAGTRCSNASGSSGPRLDYILVHDTEGDMPKIDSADILDWVSCPSDHKPVVAGLYLPIGGSNQP